MIYNLLYILSIILIKLTEQCICQPFACLLRSQQSLLQALHATASLHQSNTRVYRRIFCKVGDSENTRWQTQSHCTRPTIQHKFCSSILNIFAIHFQGLKTEKFVSDYIKLHTLNPWLYDRKCVEPSVAICTISLLCMHISSVITLHLFSCYYL